MAHFLAAAHALGLDTPRAPLTPGTADPVLPPKPLRSPKALPEDVCRDWAC